MIYPQNFEQKTGFDKVRRLISEKCLSPLGEERVAEMEFSADYQTVTRRLEQTDEFVRILHGEDEFPASYFFDVRYSLKRIRPEGTWLDEKELFDLKRSLQTINDIIRFFRPSLEEGEEIKYPALTALAGDIQVFPQLIGKIDAILDKFGRVKDNASSSLAQIRKEITATMSGISRSLQSILRAAQSEGIIDKDITPTMRDGRLMIPVAPAFKRKIKGIVHDESASGKTVFIEPEVVVEANNRIRELEGDERREIMKILTVVVIAIIALILVFTVGKAAGVFKSFGGITTEDEADASGKVTVPDIRGLTEEQAKSVLNKKHLGIKIVKRTESKKYKAGLISKQTPEAGEKVKKNTTIEVVVSSGQVKSKKQVPDVRGTSETEAQKELEDAGFKVTSSFQYDDSVASGNVISTTPSAGTKAEKGSTVTMLVSQGTDKKTVPDVRGMADATAQSTIKNYGFNVGTVTYDYSDSVEKGMVISQTVTPGGKAAAGTTISITVSNGPKPEEKIDIQSFVGQQESALKSWASQNGLYTNVSDSQYSSSYAKGCIISMSPSSGNISKGGTISYVVSLGAKPQEPTNGGTTGDNNNQNGSNTNDGTTTGQ